MSGESINMSESELLKQRLKQMQNDLQKQKDSIQQQLQAKQREIQIQKDQLAEKMKGKSSQSSTRNSPYSTTTVRTSQTSRTRGGNVYRGGYKGTRNEPPSSFRTNINKLKLLSKEKKQLFKNVYKNRIKFNYKNRIVLSDLKFVLTNNNSKLSLISTHFISSNKEIASINDLKTILIYDSKKYIKTFTGDYVLQNSPSTRSQSHQQDETAKEPCIYFIRTGECPYFPSCQYLHSPAQLSLCKSILQSKKCYNPKCKLSHNPNQFNSPSCRYFQEGNCTNVNCIYSHKLESSKSSTSASTSVVIAPSSTVATAAIIAGTDGNKGTKDTLICRQFAINGFCELGRACPYAHYFNCPDLQEFGYCLKDEKHCKLNHNFLKSSTAHGEDVDEGENEKVVVRNMDNDDVVISYDDDDSAKGQDLDYSLLEKMLLRNLDDLDESDGNYNGTDGEPQEVIEQKGDRDLATNKDYVEV